MLVSKQKANNRKKMIPDSGPVASTYFVASNEGLPSSPRWNFNINISVYFVTKASISTIPGKKNWVQISVQTHRHLIRHFLNNMISQYFPCGSFILCVFPWNWACSAQTVPPLLGQGRRGPCSGSRISGDPALWGIRRYIVSK